MQFLFAVDRGTPSLYDRYDFLSQPVLDMFEQVLALAKAARGGAGVPVSLCGEAAARPLEAMTLVGLGLTSLSMSASGLLGIKALLRQVDLTTFRPVLASIRRGSGGAASLREPIAAWAREHGILV